MKNMDWSYMESLLTARERCLANTKYEKTVTRHIGADFIERAEDARRTPQYRDLYRLRQEKIERIFADAKEKYGMRYTLYRGLTQVSNWAKLQFAAMNLKKLAVWKWKTSICSLISRFFILKYARTLISALRKRLGFFDSLKPSMKSHRRFFYKRGKNAIYYQSKRAPVAQAMMHVKLRDALTQYESRTEPSDVSICGDISASENLKVTLELDFAQKK